jgi:peptidoglycan/LPS O-acetylase OafA/YrhL
MAATDTSRPTAAPGSPVPGPNRSRRHGVTTGGPPRRSVPVRMGYQPGLDGLRAVAVLAVVLYHADISWLPGGFLGVEVFFVVSGFLITSLLVDERHQTGAVSLRQFWVRRARRLLPALYVVLLVVSVVGLLFVPDAAGRLGGDVLAALFYVFNWWQIFLQESYFASAGRPPLLQHLWSLAVEEQFYLLFPPLFLLAYRRWGRDVARWGLLGVAVASAVWMAILFDPVDPSRVYYGTDTRLSGLLLGAVLALSWSPWRSNRRPAPGAGAALDATGVLGLAVLAWFFLRVNEFDPFMYRGGFLVLDVVCLVLIAVLVHPSARLSRVLGSRPLRWVGLRSYSIYLWHWPIFVLTRPQLDVPLTGLPLFVLRMALTLAAAELSFRYVETPVRHGAVGDWWHRLRSSSGMAHVYTVRRTTVVGGAAALVVVMVGWGLQHAASSPERDRLAMESTGLPMELIDQGTLVGTDGVPIGGPAEGVATASAPDPPAPAATAPDTPPVTGSTLVDGDVVETTATDALAVGDSVMLGAKRAMQDAMPGITVNAVVGRQFGTVISSVRWFVKEGLAPGPVVVNAGTNGTFEDDDLDDLVDAAGGRKLLLVNTKSEKKWESLMNERMAAAAARHPDRVVLVDWHGLAVQHPEWFAKDGTHLKPAGARAFADLIRSSL